MDTLGRQESSKGTSLGHGLVAGAMFLASCGTSSAEIPTGNYEAFSHEPVAAEPLDYEQKSVGALDSFRLELERPAVAPQLYVDGDVIRNAVTGEPHTAIGVGMHSADYMCINGWLDEEHGLLDVDPDEVLKSALDLGADTLRLPVNSHCWLGPEHPELADLELDANTTGAPYREFVIDLIETFNDSGLAVIIDLHRSEDPDSGKALDQNNMIDSQTGVDFWVSIAEQFGNNQSIIVELYNEPHDINLETWLHGGEEHGEQYAGMQPVLDAFRQAGGTNMVIVNPPGWAHDVPAIAGILPVDPLENMTVGFHSYKNEGLDQVYSSPDGWTAVVESVAVPIFVTEFGTQLDGKGEADHEFSKDLALWWLSRPPGTVGIAAIAMNPSFERDGHRLVDEQEDGSLELTPHGKAYDAAIKEHRLASVLQFEP